MGWPWQLEHWLGPGVCTVLTGCGAVCRCVDLLKVDVERAELQVLWGIQQQHWPLIQQVTMEVRQQHSPLMFELALSASGWVDNPAGCHPA